MGLIFKFKQFEVNQAGCAMKINTDGVLLAAMACDLAPQYIVDIGTGTGVIAMMLAQAHEEAKIDALEIDQQAADRAKENFKNSPYHKQLAVHYGNFLAFRPTQLIDLIISNPPFYTNSLHNPDERKKIARHADQLFFENLLHFAKDFLSADGVLQIIVPTALATEIKESLLFKYDLFLQMECNIASFENEEILRVILRVGRNRSSTDQHHLYIYERKNEYSAGYKKLLKPYFLAF